MSFKKTDFGYKDVSTILLENRIIMVYGEVNDAMSYQVTSALHILHNEDKHKPIQCFISSPGGSIRDGMAIIDTMRLLQKDLVISTICTGIAASMGCAILVAGTPGYRMALPNSELLVHNAIGGAQGSFKDAEIDFKHFQAVNERMAAYMAEKVGMDLKAYKKEVERDHWLWPEEALPGKFGTKGIIDKIVEMGDIYVPEVED